MNHSYPAFLTFHSLSNCFVYTQCSQTFGSNQDSNRSTETSGKSFVGNFRIRSLDNENVYADVQLYGRIPFTHVSMNSVFASISGFRESQEVVLEKISETANCLSVEVSPRTEEDYSVIAHSRSSIELDFLNQVRLISKNMIVPYFVSAGVYIQLRVLNIQPNTDSSVILNEETELHVKTALETSKSSEQNYISTSVYKIVNNLSSEGFQTDYTISLEDNELYYRVLPKKLVESWLHSQAKLLDKSTIYILGKNAYNEFGVVNVRRGNVIDNQNCFYYLQKISTIFQNDKHNSKVAHLLKSLKLPTKVHCIDASEQFEEYTTIELSPVPPQLIVRLKKIDVILDETTHDWIEEYGLTTHLLKNVKSKFKAHPFLLTFNGTEIDLNVEDKTILVKFVPNLKKQQLKNSRKSCYLFDDSTEINLVKSNSKDMDKSEDPKVQSNNNEDELTSSNYGLLDFGDIVNIGSHSIILTEIVNSCVLPKSHVFVLGGSGSGKTYFLKRIARRLAHHSCVYFCKMVQCSIFKGKTADNIEKTLKDIFNDLELKKPSVLLLDDFDTILPQIDQDQRQLPAEKIVSVFCEKLKSTKIKVILTAQRLSSVNQDFIEQAVRARPIVSNIFELGSLTEHDRLDLFTEWTLDSRFDYSDLVQRTDGYTISEIQKLATTICVEREIRGSTSVQSEDVQKALDNFVAGKIKNNDGNEVLPTLDDVGGMKKQKQLLEQVIIWPKMYPKLFESVGIPVTKGVLLYGPSGCGKTLLANAIISHSKFSVISVKGPELLSKYIGSSEENVRAVFEKARSCSPCILFFDELDSLAPKRGSDSTGVTDRVVNQLLTELDGAEGGMNGVTVLGCTSRIDLIDEALLRPGRFDHHIKCTYPTKDERVEILKVLLSKLNSTGIEVDRIAEVTEGWSNADLQLLLTNAQFNAARKESNQGDDDVLITQMDVDEVFESSRPKPRKNMDTGIVGQKITLA